MGKTHKLIYSDAILSKCFSFSSAEEKKIQGNEFHKTKDYKSAINCYSEAISLDPSNFSLFGNRCASHMMLGQYISALDDAKMSTSLNTNFIKVRA